MKVLYTLLAIPLSLLLTIGLFSGLIIIIFPLYGLLLMGIAESINYIQPVKGFVIIGVALAFPIATGISFWLHSLLEEKVDYILGWGAAQGMFLVLITIAFGN